jgi:UDP-N-acetylglucosamine 2-epimerase (non-hydrolysing)/GDP/UDP-N,N'-diacetylbacillosamine 2-epimerase (hydrolysing)
VTALVQEIDWYSFLDRAPLPQAREESLALLRKQTVLVTGAGGSIGSALTRRLAELDCQVILLESAESRLHELQRELSRKSDKHRFHLGSAADRVLMNEIFGLDHPRFVFHTAAFKHVPMLEEQPLAAIANNVFATEAVARTAAKHSARVVLLSTDKAVEPASVMGATKNVAEQVVLHNGGLVVRLVNVLGSRGSVSEVFAAQIASGATLTVTDRAATRYFIMVSEAVELLLAAAVRDDQRAIFVPNLEKAQRIGDLARFMSDVLAPRREVNIEFTRLRPGEKKTEQLWAGDEKPNGVGTEGLLRIEPPSQSNRLAGSLEKLRDHVDRRNRSGAINCLGELVPAYRRTAATNQKLYMSLLNGGSNRRRIAVVTTSRADYSHLYWVLRELDANPSIELGVLALGPHLSPQFGSTLSEIEKDGFQIKARIECLLSSDTDTGMAKTIGIATQSLADALTAWRPDILLLIADRYEMLAPASVAVAMRIPIAHIEGGEVSQGAIDDQVRNAITKLAHIHFTSTEKARRRVIAMGEEEWRVHHAGAPSLDHLKRSKLLSREELEARLGLKLTHPSILAAWHPVTILRDTNAEADALFEALENVHGQLIFVYPNTDAGSLALIERTRSLAANRADTHVFVNLDAVTYWSLLGQVDVMIGNSSSGIMEAASFALPVVNVGMRQQGRERARNLIDVRAEKEAIVRGLESALQPDFRKELEGLKNPYGDGMAAKTIAQTLRMVRLDGLLMKEPTPVE